MGIVYELTFFLALGLLTIVVVIFVLAVSLLGRAIKMSSEEQEKTEREQKEATEEEISKIQKDIERAGKSGQLDIEELENRLKQMKKQKKKHERQLKYIKEKPRFLQVTWGVLIPGAFFVASIVLSWLALYWLNSAFTASLSLWGGALGAIGVGIYLICQSLKVIEGVAITSEETAFMREAEVFKTALKEFEEEKKPELQLLFADEQPPFHVKAEEQKKLEFGLRVSRGNIARNPVVGFFAPKGFVFPDRPTWLQPKGERIIGGFVTTSFHLDDCLKGVVSSKRITIKAPSEKGTYSILYRVHCEGFVSDYEEFEIVVE